MLVFHDKSAFIFCHPKIPTKYLSDDIKQKLLLFPLRKKDGIEVLAAVLACSHIFHQPVGNPNSATYNMSTTYQYPHTAHT